MQTEHYKDNSPCQCDRMVREHFESGSLRTEVPFIDDVPNGICKEYYESGELEYETTYVNGVMHGKQVCYEPFDVYHRHLQRDMVDFFGVIHEEPKVVVDPDWVYKYETPFEYGIKQGLGFGYYYSEIVAVENRFENDIWVYQKIFYPSGKIESEIAYRNELKNGIERHYNKSGFIEYEVPYTDGKIHGVMLIHHRDETTDSVYLVDEHPRYDYPDCPPGAVTRIPYDVGIRNGLETTHSSEGILLYQVEWKDDKRSGKSQSFFPDGMLFKEAVYSYEADYGYKTFETYPLGQIGIDDSINHGYMPRRDFGSVKETKGAEDTRRLYEYIFNNRGYSIEVMIDSAGKEISRCHFKGTELLFM